jgi:hypothetical protein
MRPTTFLRSLLWTLPLCTALLVPGVASAKVKAKLQCSLKSMSEEGELVLTKLPSYKVKRFDSPISCTLSVTSTDGMTYKSAIWTKRKVKNPYTAESTVVEGSPQTDTVSDANGPGQSTADLAQIMDGQPGDYYACQPFDIIANITDDTSKVLWKDKVTLTPRCAAPKTLKTSMTCEMTNADGTKTELPAKGKPRLPKGGISCHLTSQDPALSEAKVTAWTKWKSKDATGSTQKHLGPPHALTLRSEAGQVVSDLSFKLATDYERCSEPLDVRLRGTNADQQLLFEKTLTIKQICPKPKLVKAAFGCVLKTPDGTELKLPDRNKRRLDGEAIYCALSSEDSRLVAPGAVRLQTSWESWGDQGKVERKGPLHKDADVGAEGERNTALFTLKPETDFEVCSGALKLKAQVVDEEDAVVLDQVIKVKQQCDD